MRRSQVAALVIGFVVAAGASGAALWLHTSNELAAVTARLGVPAKPSVAQAPSAGDQVTASREVAAASKPAAVSSLPEPPGASASIARAKSDDPSFDIVRVEPRGDTVVAGKAAPDTKVALMSAGKVVGEAQTDASGQFVILPPPLTPGDYDLTLHQQPQNGSPARYSTQSVAVSVPKPGKGAVVVALAEPGKATKLLSAASDRAARAAAPPPGMVAIHSAELENGTGFFVSGAAPASAHVHVYLNDAHIADVVAGADGAWSVRVKRGLTGGHYVVRADLARPDGRQVASRVEVPFDVPTAMAASAASTAVALVKPDAPRAPVLADAAARADAVLDQVATARVTAGDNLWNISRFRLGDGKRYTQIYAANAGQIRDPNLIYPGQILVVPAPSR